MADSVKSIPIPILNKALIWARAHGSAGKNGYFTSLVEDLTFGMSHDINPREEGV